MAQTLVSSFAGPAATGKKPALSMEERPAAFKHYYFDFDTANYVVGGESIAAIWDDFNTVLHISVEQHDTNTAADRREFAVDYTAKTLLVYDAFNTEETASDQTVIKVGLLVYGTI